MKKKVILTLVIIGLAGGVAWKAYNAAHFLYAGTLEATEVDISPQVTGRIAALDVKEGDAVTQDQTLIELACEDVKLSAQQAERDFKRGENLRHSGSIPQETFEKLKYQNDQAQLAAHWCTIKSPLNGTVLDKYHEPGELVNPSMKLLTLANLSEVWAYLYVPQPLLAKLSLNMELEGTLPEMNGRTFRGRISHIRDEAEFTPKNVQTRDERTRLVYGVKVSFPNSDLTLKPGMTIEVKLPK